MSTTPSDATYDPSKKPPASSAPSSSQQRSGRRPSAVWEFFAAIRTEHNTVHAQCRFCARQCAGVASRMAQHILTKCTNAPRAAVDALGGDAAIAATAAGKKRKSTGAAVGGESGDKTQSSRATMAKKKKSVSPVLTPTAPLASDELPSIPAATTSTNSTAGTNGTIGSGEPAVAMAQQKLVLACVLNDVPLSFVEDAALMDAFEALAPGFPRLSTDRAETEVLSQVHRDVIAQIDAALREKQQFAVLHRRIPRPLHDPQGASTLVDVWTGVEDRREPPILLTEVSTDAAASEPRCHSLLLQEAETILSAQLARVAPTAVLSVCIESARLYSQLRQLQAEMSSATEETNAAAEPRLRAVMLSTCMLHETMRLQRKLLQSAPAVMALLQEATMLLYALAHHPKNMSACVHEALRDVMASTETSRWDLHFRVVHRLLSIEADARACFQELATTAAQSKAATPVSPAMLPLPRASFWDELRDLHALLAPFSWAFALSESESTTSAQYLLLWLWLLSVVSSTTSTSGNPLLSEDQKEAFVAHIVRVIEAHISDHQLASLLLDPRVHGAGLSALGKRKAKALVVHVAERVFAHDQFHVVGTSTRASLLAHLGHFTEKTAQFGDTIAWEMSAGNAPQVFWNDYVDDARELAKVARAVLAFIPQTQSARAYFQQQQRATEAGDSHSQEEPLCVRQIKQFYRKQQQPQYKTTDDVMKAYASLLLPIGGPDGSKRHDQPSSGSSHTTLHADDQSSASHLPVAMAQHMQVLLSVHDDDVHDNEAVSQENEESQGEQQQQQEASQPASISSESAAASAMSSGSKDPTAPGDSDAVAPELSTSASAPAPAPEAEAASGSRAGHATGLAIDESWFAFRSEKERGAIEAAIARFFFSGAATLAVV
uniref:BED-type domain-containing protein n=1 Tax=Globisporangium ultimum (strain ATCC 200006 / CBS 805.95 / DAOM BR144) TaxID=431595 RepID=K3W6I0_GLOUD